MMKKDLNPSQNAKLMEKMDLSWKMEVPSFLKPIKGK